MAFGYVTADILKERGNLRGCLDPDPDSVAYFFGPCPADGLLVPEPLDSTTSEIRFSTQSAWGPSNWFLQMLQEKFPDLQVAWKATDEFGNFHYVYNREMLGIPYISIYVKDEQELEVEPDEIDKVVPYLNKAFENPLTKDDVFDQDGNIKEDFWDLLYEHNEKDNSRYVELTVNKEW